MPVSPVPASVGNEELRGLPRNRIDGVHRIRYGARSRLCSLGTNGVGSIVALAPPVTPQGITGCRTITPTSQRNCSRAATSSFQIGAAVCNSGKTKRTRAIAPIVLPYSTRFNPSHARSTCMLLFARLHVVARSSARFRSSTGDRQPSLTQMKLHTCSTRFSLLVCAVALCGGILRYPGRGTLACAETLPTIVAEPEDMKNALPDKGEVRTGHTVSAASFFVNGSSS